jgi:hypothetical protein
MRILIQADMVYERVKDHSMVGSVKVLLKRRAIRSR